MITDMETTTTSRTRRGSGFAGPGAVAGQGAALPIYICNGCGHDVVWAESKRTGRHYLASVSTGRQGQRYYIGANVHNCEDAEAKQHRQEIAQLEAQVNTLVADLAHAELRLSDAIEAGKSAELIEAFRDSAERYAADLAGKRADLDRLS